MTPEPGSTVPGRGAWSLVGKANRSRYYSWRLFVPRDGLTPDVSFNHRAVHLGVRGIQIMVNVSGDRLALDGVYGPAARNGVKRFQSRSGLLVDGIVGPVTARAMARGIIASSAAAKGVPAAHVWGMTELESGFDPSAVGVNGFDCGLNQINLDPVRGHGGQVTVDQAFNPVFAIGYTCSRLADARVKFGGKTASLLEYCSIAQHNSPLAAQQWYTAGVAPNDQIAKYVQLVLARAATY